jgi:hypothetical protein
MYHTERARVMESAKRNFERGLPSSWQTIGGRDYVLRRWSGGRLFELRRDGRKWALHEIANDEATFIERCSSINVALMRTNAIASNTGRE